MMENRVMDIPVSYPNGMPIEEVTAYVERAKKKYGSALRGIDISIDPNDKDYVEIRYNVSPVPFQRLRRITGYLVGDMNRWNSAKRAEEKDRVKHGTD